MSTTIELLKTSLLTSFPSGSAINYHNGYLYLVGDDANHLLMLDTSYRQLHSARLFNYAAKRIPKEKKADLETALILIGGEQAQLLLLGSAATENRKQALLIPLKNKKPDTTRITKLPFYSEALINELKVIGIREINIEGSTIMNEQLIISNRGNLSNPVNHLLFLNKDFIHSPQDLHLSMATLTINTKEYAGVSELCYFTSKDILFFTLSSEATSSAYTDGEIGNSYLGWINDFSKKIKQPAMAPDALINLPGAHKAFDKQKIEGICVEEVRDDQYTMHLVADDDKGHSRLFKVKLTMRF